MVRRTTFSEPALRAWAATADQIDVVAYEIVVVHPPHADPPPSVLAQLGPPDPRVPSSVATGLVDGRWAFVLDDGTWVLAAMGYVDRVRVLLGAQKPARLGIPGDVAQLVFVERPGPGVAPACRRPLGVRGDDARLASLLVATKVDGTHVTHAHYTQPSFASAAQVRASDRAERVEQGGDVYTREPAPTRAK